ncbi:MAG: hypothetical protein WBC18_10240 [Ottowia sp.]|uniref:hypothetical protein n=1 Tax=Ottowia sp. TaxID=1898956 RepID=UPI003C7350D2
MLSIHPTPFLRRVLLLDAITCTAAAALQLLGTAALGQWLGLGTPLLVGSAVFLVGYVALLIAMARAARVWSWLLPFIVAGNTAWGLACLALAFGGVMPVTGLGKAYLVVQALAVFVFAELEWKGWRASPNAAGLSAA